MAEQKMSLVIDKLQIQAKLVLKSGLHIGTSGDFSPIGAVDSIVVRDPVTRQPVIPGSSVKGKLRSLLAADADIAGGSNAWLPRIDDEDIKIKRLFGTGGSDKEGIIRSRLQFFDLFLTKESVEELHNADTDLYLTEVKFENAISRTTSVANPRQLERVPAGAVYDFRVNYTVESLDELLQDMQTLAKGLLLLSNDYLGKGGSRGNGRVSFSGFTVDAVLNKLDTDALIKAREALQDVSF